ncbi:MAG: response regulator [bacterium]
MTKKRILIVEDEPNIHRLAKTTLQFKDFEVISSFNGVDCIKLAKSHKLDLIILDVMMDDMDGFEVLKKLKTIKNTRQTPVAMFTAKDGAEDKEKGLKLGAVHYFTKPIDPTLFPEEVAELLTALEQEDQEQEEADIKTYDELFVELQQDFLSEFPHRLKRLRSLVKEKNVIGIRQFGHKLKGSGTSMGFERLSFLAAKIEHEAEKEDWPQVEKIYYELQQTFREIKINSASNV